MLTLLLNNSIEINDGKAAGTSIAGKMSEWWGEHDEFEREWVERTAAMRPSGWKEPIGPECPLDLNFALEHFSRRTCVYTLISKPDSLLYCT